MANKTNLIVDKGSDFKTTINLTDDNDDPINLTGYTVAAKFAKHYTSLTKYSFNTSMIAVSGQVVLELSKVATANIAYGRYVYDCELTDSANVTTRIVEGILTVSPSVTT